MAPEQASGVTRSIGPAADVYALGAILYEMLTGRPPFKSEQPIDTVLQVLRDDPVPPRRLVPSVPRDLETICLKCLEKEAARRYASAEKLADDLRRFLEGEPVQARPVGRWGRLVKWIKRRPAVAALLGLVVLVTALGLGLVTWKWQEAIQAQQVAEGRREQAEDARRDAADMARREKEARRKVEIALDGEATEREKAQRQAYFRGVTLAPLHWQANNVARAEQVLDECLPVGLRGWEWRYLKRLCHADLLTLSLSTSSLAGLTFTPDGKHLALADGKTVKLCDAATGKEVLVLAGHTGLVTGLAVSPDGKRLASGGTDRAVRLWGLPAGQPLFVLPGHTGAVWGLAFSPDGTQLASGGDDGTVRFWDVSTGKGGRVLRGHAGRVRSVAWAGAGRLVSAATDPILLAPVSRGEIFTWDVSSGDVVDRSRLPIRMPFSLSVALSPDGQRLAIACGEPTVPVWGRGRERPLVLQGHLDKVVSVAWAPDGKRLATAGHDRTVRIWDAATGKEVRTLRGHTGPVFGVAYSPDGKRLASNGVDRTVKVWDATADQEGLSLPGPLRGVQAVCFSPDCRYLALADEDRQAVELLSNDLSAWAAILLQNQPFAAAGCSSYALTVPCVRVWSLGRRREVLRLTGHRDWVKSLAYSPNGKRLASASGDGTVRVWDAATGRQLLVLEGHTNIVNCVAYSPDGKRLVSGGVDGRIKLWDAASGKEVGNLETGSGFVCAALSPDGKRLVCGYLKGALKVWDVASGREVLDLPWGRGLVLSVAFAPDGRHLACGGGMLGRGDVTVWGAETGKVVFSHTGHGSMVEAVAFSADGKRLASGGGDRAVKLWDVASGEELLTLSGHSGGVRCLAFSRDGRRLASGSGQEGAPGEARIWEAVP
jgi:WD40 repeat protein